MMHTGTSISYLSLLFESEGLSHLIIASFVKNNNKQVELSHQLY